MLFATSAGTNQHLESFARADSLIRTELANFNIDESQVRVSSVQIDSSFTRKKYHVGVPYQFSKTQFHAELNKRLYPYSVEAPAHMTFPQEDMSIHLLFRDTVIRSIVLQTDPDLTFRQNHISLLVVFEDIPGPNLINQIEQLGEPIALVLKIENPMQANELRKQLRNQYDQLIFWLQDDDGQDLIKANRSSAITKLKQLQDVIPQAVMLHYNTSGIASAEDKQQLIAQTKMTFVDAANALMLHEQMGKAEFLETLDKLHTTKSYSMGVISGNETTLSWLSQKLPDLKKAGANIIAPPKANL